MASFGVKDFLGLCVVSMLLQTVTAVEGVWSRWYSSDNPKISGVDNETVARIWLVFHDLPCQPTEVLSAQCRGTGTNDSFSGVSDIYDNTLFIPCNATGLVCRNADQNMSMGKTNCADYEIRVLCPNIASTNKPDSHYDVIGSNGGFIAMAAGGSVVLPLVFVLVIQLRKNARAERRRQAQERQSAQDQASAETAARTAVDAPPAYDELFGCSDRPESVVSVSSSSSGSDRSAGSREALIQNASSSSTLSSSSSPMLTSASTNTASQFPFSSVITSLAIHSVGVNAANGIANHAGQSHMEPARRISTMSTESLSGPVTSGRRISTASVLSGHSHTSTDALLPYSSLSHVIHEDPPPAYDAHTGSSTSLTIVAPVFTATANNAGTTNNSNSSNSSVSTNNPVSIISTPNTSSSSSETAPRPVPQRRFLGMHLSIFDLMAVIYPDPVPTPPPSYDDALKILGFPS